jgi:hypothetical protein
MFRKHRHTIAYAALSAALAASGVAIWIAATGQLHFPPGVIPVFSVGAALIATGVERTVLYARRRRRPSRRAHARTHPETRKDTTPA